MTGKVTEDTRKRRASILKKNTTNLLCKGRRWKDGQRSTEIYSESLDNTQAKTYQTPGFEPVQILALPLIQEVT